MQEPTAIDRVLSFPYRIYEFIMFFIMTLIDVRARSELLSSLVPTHACFSRAFCSCALPFSLPSPLLLRHRSQPKAAKKASESMRSSSVRSGGARAGGSGTGMARNLRGMGNVKSSASNCGPAGG